ncbi:hypothetical protein CAPTEDRAFT_218243 [Capitella teleta]|uniref:Uncharacterized protein n=1 Tax=Capitella teleta TaxID=283909 RepID=R7VB46_CAPTE|nr:hypothetical protein CAPTEDRAFT_218243 [Capitella teleta]|eukprot:ELU13546.1 hypothetical protein CAPTEDRAFT_218243 [Capitella teleta]
MKTRRKLDNATTQNHCFICDKEFKDMKSMRRVSTFGVDKAVKEAVVKIGDSSLRRKISEAEDLIAMDAVYHAACLTRLYRKAEKAGELKIPESENDMPADECVDEKAFDAMIEHLLEQRGSVALISLISLRTFYLQQLDSFGYKATIDFVHATKLRHRIIERLPDVKFIEKNRIWYLFFNEDAHHAILNCSASDINLLSKAATLLRKDILNKKQKFTGSFSSSSEADSVTDSLLVFMRMVLDGPTPGKIDVPSSSDKIALSLSELIMFNCVEKRSSSSRKLRHNQERETPLPLILAMKIHMKTGQKTLVDTLTEQGLCTSYSRTNQIACDLANTAITIWEEEGVVFPLQAEKGVFTTDVALVVPEYLRVSSAVSENKCRSGVATFTVDPDLIDHACGHTSLVLFVMASTSLSSTQRDWAKCFLCQKDDGTTLKTPGQTPRYLANPDELGASFRSTIVNLKSLHDLGELPSYIFAEDIVNLGDGVCMNEFINSMMNHGVVWHKLCRNAVDTQKVKRAQRKRSAAVDISEDLGVLDDSDITKTFERKSPMKTRRKLDNATTQNHCFICDKEFKDMKSMRRVSTFGVDKAVKEAVVKIGDKKRSSSSRKLRHNQERETPLPLILAMKIHMKTGQKTLVDTLTEQGLCTSYSRTNQIACDLANTAITIWEEEGVVFPLQAEKGVFTTGGMDNIDYNPSSATSQITLHGTGISIVQHHSLATISPQQAHENMINPAVSGKKSVMPLPQSYCGMEDISYVHREKVFVPKTNFDGEIFPFESCEAEILESGYAWLDEVKRLSEQPLAEDDSISWGAYYASLSEPPSFVSRSFMLPLFTEKADSPLTVHHCMKVIIKVTNYLNQGQTPVMVGDQPLFTLAKRLQWSHPNSEISEGKFVVMLGALHIEKLLWAVSGDWLDYSGWTTAVTNSGIFSCANSQSFVSVSHIMKTRYVHQVSVSTLYILMKKAYQSNSPQNIPLSEWIENKRAKHPQAEFWHRSFVLDLLILQFVKACRCGDFNSYCATLHQLMPYVTALNHPNYARNLPIHLRDMANLKNKHPDVYQEFQAGHFVGQKTRRKFSMMPLDQIHEQLNSKMLKKASKKLKNESGTIGNLDDPATVRREQVSRPEMARLIQEVEGSKDQSTRHHEQYPQYQKKFKEDVLNLIQAFEDLGNPFLEESADLLDLDQSIMMPDDVINNVRKISSFGRELYNKFLNERVFDQKVPFNETLKEVNLRLFKDVLKSKSKSTKATISALKDEHSKASHLLLAAQGGRPISDDLFGHESSKFPPALTKDGVIYLSTKSEILDCLCVQEKQVAPDTTCALLDGAVVVQMLRPKNSTTFGDYCADVFLQYVLTMLKTKDRINDPPRVKQLSFNFEINAVSMIESSLLLVTEGHKWGNEPSSIWSHSFLEITLHYIQIRATTKEEKDEFLANALMLH